VDRNGIVATITDALTEVMQREFTGITEDTRLFEDLHLDSTSILTLLMALEDKAGIEVDPEALDMDSFRTIGTLADYLQSALDITV
jgi:acyl carrier protein